MERYFGVEISDLQREFSKSFHECSEGFAFLLFDVEEGQGGQMMQFVGGKLGAK